MNRGLLLLRRKSVLALLGVVALLVASAVFASVALATPPTTTAFNISGSVTIPAGALCSFPILLEGTRTGTVTLFYDQNGVISERNIHGFEQDTFTANGKTLQGDPYPFNLFHDYVDGVPVTSYGTGVAERVPLPDGSVYIVAGREDFLTIPAGAPILFVDSGNSGNNLDAFCAALS